MLSWYIPNMSNLCIFVHQTYHSWGSSRTMNLFYNSVGIMKYVIAFCQLTQVLTPTQHVIIAILSTKKI